MLFWIDAMAKSNNKYEARIAHVDNDSSNAGLSVVKSERVIRPGNMFNTVLEFGAPGEK